MHACTFCSHSVLARPTPPLLPPLPPLIATADSALRVPGHASGAAANGKRGRTVATRDRRAERAPGESEAAAGFPDVDQHCEAAAPAHHRPPPASALHAHALRAVGASRPDHVARALASGAHVQPQALRHAARRLRQVGGAGGGHRADEQAAARGPGALPLPLPPARLPMLAEGDARCWRRLGRQRRRHGQQALDRLLSGGQAARLARGVACARARTRAAPLARAGGDRTAESQADGYCGQTLYRADAAYRAVSRMDALESAHAGARRPASPISAGPAAARESLHHGPSC